MMSKEIKVVELYSFADLEEQEENHKHMYTLYIDRKIANDDMKMVIK